jgi:hypothetical protein
MLLQNPFEFGAMPLTPDEAAVSPGLQASDTAADFSTDCIGEIFAGARKLFDPDPAAYTSADQAYYDLLLQLDDPHAADLVAIPEGMLGEFDPLPVFLEQMRA